MNYEEKERQICRECSTKETCTYVPRKLEYKCQHLSDMMYSWELGYKDVIGKACEWLENTFHDRSHHSGRGDAGEIVTYDFDSMQEFILKFRKAMEEQQ